MTHPTVTLKGFSQDKMLWACLEAWTYNKGKYNLCGPDFPHLDPVIYNDKNHGSLECRRTRSGNIICEYKGTTDAD